jgi:hypothetical protein
MTPDKMRELALDHYKEASGKVAQGKGPGNYELQGDLWNVAAEICERLDKLAERPPVVDVKSDSGPPERAYRVEYGLALDNDVVWVVKQEGNGMEPDS